MRLAVLCPQLLTRVAGTMTRRKLRDVVPVMGWMYQVEPQSLGFVVSPNTAVMYGADRFDSALPDTKVNVVFTIPSTYHST